MNEVFVDIDTQLDFVAPAGALYARGAEALAQKWSALTRYAAREGVKLISTVDAHTENDREFTVWKPHCVAGTAGQAKLGSTLVDKRCTLSTRPGSLDISLALAASQIVVEKQTVDVFSNSNLVPLLKELGPSRFFVYGVVTEVCVLYTARGLLQAGYDVELVTDAIWPFSNEAGERAVQELLGLGAQLTTTNGIGL
jgi:nicotinamidase/pyrazinamidase